jgi:hypothetical protein
LVILPLAGGEAWLRFRTWRGNRRAVAAAREMQARYNPVEEVRAFDAGKVALPRRRRRDCGIYLPTAPRIPSHRHSPILDREASERLWRLVNGDRAL